MAAYDMVFTVTGTGDKTLTPKMIFSGGTGITYAVSGGGASGSLTSNVEANFIAAGGTTVTYSVSDGCTVTMVNLTSDPISGNINQIAQSVTTIALANCGGITGNLSSLVNNNLVYLDLSNNPLLEGNISSIATRGIATLNFNGCVLLTGDISALSAAMGAALVVLNLANCALLTYSSPSGMFSKMDASLTSITLTGCTGLTAAMVDNIFADLLYAAANNSCTGKTITIQTDVVAPTQDGYVSAQKLRLGYSWTVTFTVPTSVSVAVTEANALYLTPIGVYHLEDDLTIAYDAIAPKGNCCGGTNATPVAFNGVIDFRGHSMTFDLRGTDSVDYVGLFRVLGNAVIRRPWFLDCTLSSEEASGASCCYGLICGGLKYEDVGNGQGQVLIEDVRVDNCHYEDGKNGKKTLGNNLSLLCGQLYNTGVGATPAAITVRNVNIRNSSIKASTVTTAQTNHAPVFSKIDPRDVVDIDISNVIVDGVEVNGYSAGENTSLFAGSLRNGAAYLIDIHDCKVKNSELTVTGRDAGAFFGAIVGTIGNVAKKQIYDCEVDSCTIMTVPVAGAAPTNGRGAAGFVAYGSYATISRCSVKRTTINGAMYDIDLGTKQYNDLAQGGRIGGFCGEQIGAIFTDCYADVTIAVVSGVVASCGFSGRIDAGSFDNCYCVARAAASITLPNFYDLTFDAAHGLSVAAVLYADSGGETVIGTILDDPLVTDTKVCCILPGAGIASAVADATVYDALGEVVGTLSVDAARSVRACALSAGFAQNKTGVSISATNCYYDNDVTTIAGAKTGATGTAKTTAQMKQIATFTDWSIGLFDGSTWRIINDYPQLVSLEKINVNELYNNGLNDLYGSGINAAYSNGQNDLVTSGLNKAYGTV